MNYLIIISNHLNKSENQKAKGVKIFASLVYAYSKMRSRFLIISVLTVVFFWKWTMALCTHRGSTIYWDFISLKMLERVRVMYKYSREVLVQT